MTQREPQETSRPCRNSQKSKTVDIIRLLVFPGGGDWGVHRRLGRYDRCAVSPRPNPAPAPLTTLLTDRTHRIIYILVYIYIYTYCYRQTPLPFIFCLSASDFCHHCCRRDRLAFETVHPPQLRWCRRRSMGSWTICAIPTTLPVLLTAPI